MFVRFVLGSVAGEEVFDLISDGSGFAHHFIEIWLLLKRHWKSFGEWRTSRFPFFLFFRDLRWFWVWSLNWLAFVWKRMLHRCSVLLIVKVTVLLQVPSELIWNSATIALTENSFKDETLVQWKCEGYLRDFRFSVSERERSDSLTSSYLNFDFRSSLDEISSDFSDLSLRLDFLSDFLRSEADGVSTLSHVKLGKKELQFGNFPSALAVHERCFSLSCHSDDITRDINLNSLNENVLIEKTLRIGEGWVFCKGISTTCCRGFLARSNWT